MPVRWDNIKLQARLRTIVLIIGVALVLGHWVATMMKPRGDFSRHWEFGRRFVADEFLYAEGLDVPYPPFFAVAYAPLSLMPLRVAKPLFFLLGFAALAGLLWILNELSRKSLPLSRERLFWVAAATLLVTSRFVSRDFADGGQNLILLGLTWGAIYLWKIGRNISGGASLGLAIALKCTPVLFVAYFAWKRQWQFAVASLLFAAAFTLTPALRQSTYAMHMQTWFDAVYEGVRQPDPSVGVLGPEELQNKSLRPALARFLTHLPAEAPGRVDSPGYIDFLDLQPRTAGVIIKVVMLLLLAAVVWMLRHPLVNRDDPMLVWECATISLLTLLYSPITWGQHCVAAIPALYLLFRSIATGQRLARWMYWTLSGVTLVVLLLNRSIIGRDLSLLLESYHLITFCLLALLVVVLWCPKPAHE
jgi:hypothetical protein